MDEILSFFSSDPNALATILSALIGAIASIIIAILRARPQTIDDLLGVVRVMVTLITKVLLASISVVGVYLLVTHAITFYQSRPKPVPTRESPHQPLPLFQHVHALRIKLS
jgi:hypothetical protein